MKISYKPLWRTLLEKDMKKQDLRELAGLATNALANMGKGQPVSLSTIVRICEALNCDIPDVIELVRVEEQ